MFGWLPNLAMLQVQPPNLWQAKRLQHFYECGKQNMSFRTGWPNLKNYKYQ
jgi:hypothetical protein